MYMLHTAYTNKLSDAVEFVTIRSRINIKSFKIMLTFELKLNEPVIGARKSPTGRHNMLARRYSV